MRYFAPEEIARLHGHRPGFTFAGLPARDGWKLVGNGLSVPVVRWVLSWVHTPSASGGGRMVTRVGVIRLDVEGLGQARHAGSLQPCLQLPARPRRAGMVYFTM